MHKVNQLYEKLLSSNRLDDWQKSVTDESYQQKLLKEYGI